VQASAVPCESAFLRGSRLQHPIENRLNPALMKPPTLKYIYKQDRLDFTRDVLAREEDYRIEGEVTERLLRNFCMGKSEELRDLLVMYRAHNPYLSYSIIHTLSR